MEDALGLAMERGLPYSGLRDFTPDQRLFRYLPLAECERRGVVPVMVVADRLKVAASTPEPDLHLLEQRFPFLGVDIVLAPREEIAAALQRARGARA